MAEAAVETRAEEQRTALGGVWHAARREFTDPEKRTAYWMIAPVVLIILLVAVFPILYGIYLSLQSSLPGQAGQWVWFDNYVEMFGDSDFLIAMRNSAVFTIASVFFEFIFGLLIALALNRAFVGRGPVRAIALVPWAFPTVISAIMWRLMYQDEVGIMRFMAEKIGLISGSILSNDTALMIGAIVVDIWKTTPFMAILLLAGLQVISEDVYEAARVDGATPMQSFFRITLPLLKPAILVALLFRTLDAWRIYDLFWGMAQRELDSLSTYVYEGIRISTLGFDTGNAAAVFIFISSLVIAFVFIKVLGTRTTE